MKIEDALSEANDVWDDSSGPVIRTLAAELKRYRALEAAAQLQIEADTKKLAEIEFTPEMEAAFASGGYVYKVWVSCTEWLGLRQELDDAYRRLVLCHDDADKYQVRALDAEKTASGLRAELTQLQEAALLELELLSDEQRKVFDEQNVLLLDEGETPISVAEFLKCRLLDDATEHALKLEVLLRRFVDYISPHDRGPDREGMPSWWSSYIDELDNIARTAATELDEH